MAYRACLTCPDVCDMSSHDTTCLGVAWPTWCCWDLLRPVVYVASTCASDPSRCLVTPGNASTPQPCHLLPPTTTPTSLPATPIDPDTHPPFHHTRPLQVPSMFLHNDLTAFEDGMSGSQVQEELERRAALGRPLRSADQLPDEAHMGASLGMRFLLVERHRQAAHNGGLPKDQRWEDPLGGWPGGGLSVCVGGGGACCCAAVGWCCGCLSVLWCHL